MCQGSVVPSVCFGEYSLDDTTTVTALIIINTNTNHYVTPDVMNDPFKPFFHEILLYDHCLVCPVCPIDLSRTTRVRHRETEVRLNTGCQPSTFHPHCTVLPIVHLRPPSSLRPPQMTIEMILCECKYTSLC